MRLRTINESIKEAAKPGRPKKPKGNYTVDVTDDLKWDAFFKILMSHVFTKDNFPARLDSDEKGGTFFITMPDKSSKLESKLKELEIDFKLSPTPFVTEATVTKPDIPNTQSFWHGGNLDDYDDVIAQKNGKYEYGPGLYIINHYGTAQKYAKGSRKMYMVTVENGNDINDAKISLDALNEFVDEYVIGSKRKAVKAGLEKYAKDGQVKAYMFNNMMVNEKAVKPSNTGAWREFLVSQGIDYEIVSNPFGWGEKMMVLYNMKKIKKIQQISPKDKIEDYDMLMDKKEK